MKPREFDDLIRQKFDRSDFEYNPRSWDKLEDQLDGRAKKRSILIWWLMPVAGVAASVALAMGISPVFYQSGEGTNPGGELAQTHKTEYVKPAQKAVAQTAVVPTTTFEYNKAIKKTRKQVVKPQPEEPREEKFAINYHNAVKNMWNKAAINLLDAPGKPETKKQDKKKEVVVEDAVATFKPEAVKAPAKISIIISGGYSRGSQNSGYTAGATIRKAVNDKVFIEGDIAFTNSSIVQGMPYVNTTRQYIDNGGGSSSGSKTTNTESGGKPTSETKAVSGPIESRNVSYSLSYAQITPSISVKVMKRLSIGAGPDFQRVLADNRPERDGTDPTGSFKTAPIFDMGLMGKTEFSVTKNVKAGVAYRKGINNILTPMGKYLDRDYLQFQVKCAIFNK